ncbi:hypothetical protein V9T40_005644 [Parthenolecanium corni]|uniref:Uncharacterized protein n=1 Tax=Parthenolecanium corni TaxID=536013 RepID=A0AAN9Y8W4_9HEMI
MKNSPPAFILVSVAAIVVASAFADHNLLCCGNSSVLLHYGSYQCEDGQELLLPCNSNDVSYLGTRKEDHKTVDDETKMYENEQLTVYPPE